MSSRLNSIYDSNHSDSPPSVLYVPGVFDNSRELSEEIVAPTEIYDISKTYYGFKSVRVIEPPCINCFQTVPEDYGAASRRVENLDWKLLLMNPQPLMPPLFNPINNTNSSWAKIGGPIQPQGNPIGVAPEVSVLVTQKYERLGKLKRNLVFQDGVHTDSEVSYELDGEDLEMTTHIQKRRIQSTSLYPVQFSTTIHEVIRSPQPPQLPTRSPTRPSTLASTSTNVQLPMASTS
ncbi:hypothetical protein O181_109326 [Austropuccinia psidii MF-1]|uniref:Uncharacterized protein n=1 Tax=Austropuccinia psidii MF-1 TaxID=1389203 RepID=A0A9Q3JWJ5_9BASI|nr:hypothetical protein [Austropuccinia psidii MF-1]